MNAKASKLRVRAGERVPRSRHGGLALPSPVTHAVNGFSEACNLSSRETQVMHLACSGLKNIAIANALSISVPTVRLHLRNGYRKSGAEGKLEFVIAAWLWSLKHFASGRARRAPILKDTYSRG